MLAKSQIGYIRSLHQKKFRQRYGKFLVEGVKNVQELLNSHFNIDTIYYTSAYRVSLPVNIRAVEISEEELKKISTQTTPDKVLAIAHIPLQDLRLPPPDKYSLLLDGINDPGNLGTIIRICDWFGWRQLYLSPHCADVYNPKTVAAAKGSLFRVEVHHVSLPELIRKCNMPVYGAVMRGNNIYHEPFAKGGLVVIGSESHGISEEVATLLTHKITIPGSGTADSLNAAVAAGILVSEITRRLTHKD
ncbi:MAG: RNA methyltransferase [Chitinophagales bacterium]|nr:RNA methyltransferase [Chitinophagales bacterium]MDW8419431.1 RNA methyltransferase [Chitinophagales bacterium]